MYFFVKCEKPKKNPGSLKNPATNPRASGKNPRTQDSIKKPKILRENPRSGTLSVIGVLCSYRRVKLTFLLLNCHL